MLVCLIYVIYSSGVEQFLLQVRKSLLPLLSFLSLSLSLPSSLLLLLDPLFLSLLCMWYVHLCVYVSMHAYRRTVGVLLSLSLSPYLETGSLTEPCPRVAASIP